VTVFFRNYSTYEGEPARLYRSPDSIRRDINDIKTKIETLNAKLNVRNILAGVIDESSQKEPERWITVLSDMLAGAESSLEQLKMLKEDLDILGEELEDTKWALGI
jgi:hypothetical protein